MRDNSKGSAYAFSGSTVIPLCDEEDKVQTTCGALAGNKSTYKRILMVAPQPVFEPRGTPFSVVYRIRSLCGSGHSVDLLTYPYGRNVRIDGLRIVRVPRLPGVSGVAIGPSVPKVFLDALLGIWMCAMLLRRRYDCLWSHEEAGLLCGVASRVLGIPHIYDMHSDLSQQIRNYPRFSRPPFTWLFGALTRAMVHLSDVVLTVCDDLVAALHAIAPTKKVLLVENYCTEVDFLDDQVPEVDELRRRHHLIDHPVALYAGSLEPYQGIDILLDGAEYLNRSGSACRLLIVGGRPKESQALRNAVASRHLDETVEVVGSVSPAVVASYVELADILLTARSKGTNVPLKLYGYMKSNKPIVATNIYSHTQLLDQTTAVLVEPNGLAMGKGIESIIADPAGGRRIAARAKTKAAEFSNDTFEARIKEAIRSACDRGRDDQ